MRKAKELSALFGVGFLGYPILELLWRKYTHWSMALTGGLCFVVLYQLFGRFSHWKLWKKCLLGSLAVTCIEFLVGCVVNLKLKLNVWDYSARPVNLWGQICLLYSMLWGLLCIPLCGLCTKIREVVFPRLRRLGRGR